MIGKSDSTVKRSGWQVTFCGKVPLFELKESPLCSWMPANTLKATPNGVAFNVYYAGHWPPRQFGGRWFIHRASSDFPDRFIPFEGRFFGGCSCRASAVLGLAGLLSSSLFITGAYLIAISGPIQGLFVFNDLRCLVCPGFLHYGMPSLVIMQKAIETCPPARSGAYGHPPSVLWPVKA